MNKCVYLGVSSEPWRPTFERMGSSLGEVLYFGINLLPMACLLSLMLNNVGDNIDINIDVRYQ